MNILVSFAIGTFAGCLMMAFVNGCANTNKINEAYMEGFLAGQRDKRCKMSVFDVLREKFNERHTFYENRFAEMGGTDRDVEDWGSIKSYADAIDIVNQVERLFNDTLKLNIGHKKLSADELAEHLKLHMELITFNPSTGEELKPCQMNELNQDLYTTMYHAKEFLESIPKPILPDKAEYAHEASYIQGWNECLEKFVKDV